MELDNPQDQDIIRLLTMLKDVRGEYPENLFVAQRQSYLKRMTEIELGMSGDRGSRNAAKSTKPPGESPASNTLLETALVVAIAAEASVMAFFYRDQLADFFQTLTTGSRAEEVTPAPAIPTSREVQGISPSPAITSTAAAASPTGMIAAATNTPIPVMLGNNSSTTTPGVDSTPVPNGNEGNHYGQTPKPERTKENSGNNDKPPKDDKDKPPKEKPKKTK
ncbi:MAG: hypothetical protein JW730_19830 [Anaerolineales bacterium]|nr:hypothetical protein [Anaerolineales bacterium]